MQGRSEDQRDLLDAESVVGHLVKPGSVFAFLAEHRKVLFPDEMFTDLFPSPRGRPSVPADVIASVIVLQTLHGLPDSETTDALTFDLRWKAAVGWPLTSKAFHDTTDPDGLAQTAAGQRRPEPDLHRCRHARRADWCAQGQDAPGARLHRSSETGHVQVLADSAYGSGTARATLTDAGHAAIIKPIPLRAPVTGGFPADDFTVNHPAGTATCPNGLTRSISPTNVATFGAACRGCPLRAQCTTARRGRTLRLHEHEDLLRAARRHAQTEAFTGPYRQHRPMVERSIAWLVRGGNRKVRYRGISKNDQWLHHRLAGLNLRRLLNLGLVQHQGAWVLA